MPSTSSARLERWLGKERTEQLSRNIKGWYGPKIAILDLPGNIYVHGDGDFSGPFERGYFCSAMDALEDKIKRMVRRFGDMKFDPATLHMAGFTSLANALATMSQGGGVMFAGGNIQKVGTASGAVGACVDLWYVGNNPTAGANAGAAPGGTVPTSATAGAMPFNNPTGGAFTMLTGADMQSSVAAMSVLLYDRLFAVLRAASSSATQAVTGAQTRYAGTTAGLTNYAGGNFLFVSAQGGALGAVAHNWTVCLYTNQAGTTGQTLPSVAGISACPQNALDLPLNTWFAPLAAGDTGILQLTQTQCSVATVTGSANFVIGHPIGIMAFPLANYMYPFDWLTNRNLAPRVMDSAALALLQLPQSANSATTFCGNIYGGQA